MRLPLAGRLRDCGVLIMAVVVLHNLSGYALGYLAATHFPNLAMASVPGALFSVWHNISGALLARLYARAAADRD